MNMLRITSVLAGMTLVGALGVTLVAGTSPEKDTPVISAEDEIVIPSEAPTSDSSKPEGTSDTEETPLEDTVEDHSHDTEGLVEVTDGFIVSLSDGTKVTLHLDTLWESDKWLVNHSTLSQEGLGFLYTEYSSDDAYVASEFGETLDDFVKGEWETIYGYDLPSSMGEEVTVVDSWEDEHSHKKAEVLTAHGESLLALRGYGESFEDNYSILVALGTEHPLVNETDVLMNMGKSFKITTQKH